MFTVLQLIYLYYGQFALEYTYLYTEKHVHANST